MLHFLYEQVLLAILRKGYILKAELSLVVCAKLYADLPIFAAIFMTFFYFCTSVFS
jgi:hypothetical protein